MNDNHPAEQYRAVMAELDTPPPPDPPPPPPAPRLRPVYIPPPPEKTDWWAIVRTVAIPIVVALFALYLLMHAFI